MSAQTAANLEPTRTEPRKDLRVLMVEDSEQDAELLLRHLRRAGLHVTHKRVETATQMTVALDEPWDVVLSDYTMPHFDAPSALALLQERGLDLPFIIVSGTVREDMAVRAMDAGAHDYFVKGEMGPRLIAAIERELQEAAVRAENLRMHEQLMISDCMASMGMLAAGIAHEINNPLASAMANVDLASASLGTLEAQFGSVHEISEMREELQDAREAVERIRNIVRDLKIFSRPSRKSNGPVNVEKVMESTLRMAWNEIRYRARLVKNYGPTPLVEADDGRLGQVFLNLVVNAAQAMKEGRWEDNRLTVTTSTAKNGHAVVEVVDTGPGIPPEVIGRVFQPFFTTKPPGEGTGIGLSICHRIVTDLGGEIGVQSEIGRGTHFRLTLPPARSKISEIQGPSSSATSARRRGIILVVDDEPMIGKAVKRALSREHEVTAVTTPEEAIRRIRAGEKFDVILCDLLMPEVSGMDLYDELATFSKAEAKKVIFLTGGAFTPRARTFLSEVSNQRIEKPFDPIHLRALINDRIR